MTVNINSTSWSFMRTKEKLLGVSPQDKDRGTSPPVGVCVSENQFSSFKKCSELSEPALGC